MSGGRLHRVLGGGLLPASASFVGGVGLMRLGTGPAVRATAGSLPRSLAWAAVVIGVLISISWAGFLAFMAAGLWGVVGVPLSRRPQDGAPPGTETARTARR